MDTSDHAIARRHIPYGITAPQNDEEQRVLSIAIVIASSLSILGAGCIILSFAVRCFNTVSIIFVKFLSLLFCS